MPNVGSVSSVIRIAFALVADSDVCSHLDSPAAPPNRGGSLRVTFLSQMGIAICN
jgi:hypothetical protein